MDICLLETTLFKNVILDFWDKIPIFTSKRKKGKQKKTEKTEKIEVRNDTFH